MKNRSANAPSVDVDAGKRTSGDRRRLSAWSPSMFSKVGSNVKSRISRSFSSVGTKQEFDRIAVRDGLTPTSNDSAERHS